MNSFFTKKQILAVAAACTILSSPAYAGGLPETSDTTKSAQPDSASVAAGNTLASAISGGKAYIDLRYRLENVDQDGFSKNANASTLRTNVGYKTGTYKNFSGLVEFQNVTVVGGNNYNDTLNGKTNLPVVADPASTEVNQAYLSFDGISDTNIKIGRIGLNLDNQRYIGTVGWRQNDQTYDSVVLTNTSIKDTSIVYGYVDNVNRIFSDDAPLGNLGTTTNIVNISYKGLGFAKVTGYGYFLDIDDVSALSSKTYGLRVTGSTGITKKVKALYTAEYARQSDFADNAANYSVNYWLGEIGAKCVKGHSIKVGLEVLGDEAGGTFQTPLATLHAQNGWADKFLSTPTGGLRDLYGKLSAKVPGIKAKFNLVYHDFSADNGGADYGTEWDTSLAKKINDNYSVAINYSDYNADTFSVDTQKFWLTLQAKF